MIDPGLENRVVLITGANNPHGIGAAAARAFAAQGCKIFLHYFRQFIPSSSDAPGQKDSPGESFYYAQQAKSADAIADELRGMGTAAHVFEADLGDPDVVPALFDEAERVLGPVEILFNNAAYWEGDTFTPADTELANEFIELWTGRPPTITPRGFDRLFAVNTRAPALLTTEFARRHIARNAKWGRIVNVSTDAAPCFPSEISYGASKYALESYTRSAAAELAKFGINVNVVSLGPVQTGWITPELEKALLPIIPLGRIGTPEEVADVVVFLASHQSRWITGQKLHIDGGHAK
ncbi:MAG: SDR family oxidoreductase [Bryobacteraceae bacterium]